MHIEIWGDGRRRFLAVHGWGGTHRDFAALAAKAPADVRMAAVDLPGHGQSPPPARWDIGPIVEELAELIVEEEDGPTTLIGFCSGSILAALAAVHAPHHVARLVAVEPFAFVPWYFRLFTLGGVGRRAYEAAFLSRAGRRLVNLVLRRRQATDADFTAAFGALNADVALNYMRMFTRIRLEDLRPVAAPVDIAVGDRTFGAVQRSVEMLRSLWPAARVRRLVEVGHLPLVRGARQLAALAFGGRPRRREGSGGAR